jgi:hypothetical protein
MHTTTMPISLIRKSGLLSRVAAVLLVLMASLGGGVMPSMAHAGPHQAAVLELGCVHVDGTLSNAFTGHSHDMNCCGGMGALCAFHCTHIFLAPMTLSHGGTGASTPIAATLSSPSQAFPVPPWHPPTAA